MSDQTYYDVLGVSRTAPTSEIKAAYRSLIAQYHPDKNQGATEAVRKLAGEKAQEVIEAHGVLSDPVRRRIYNELIDTHQTRGTQSPPQQAPARPQQTRARAQAAQPTPQPQPTPQSTTVQPTSVRANVSPRRKELYQLIMVLVVVIGGLLKLVDIADNSQQQVAKNRPQQVHQHRYWASLKVDCGIHVTTGKVVQTAFVLPPIAACGWPDARVVSIPRDQLNDAVNDGGIAVTPVYAKDKGLMGWANEPHSVYLAADGKTKLTAAAMAARQQHSAPDQLSPEEVEFAPEASAARSKAGSAAARSGAASPAKTTSELKSPNVPPASLPADFQGFDEEASSKKPLDIKKAPQSVFDSSSNTTDTRHPDLSQLTHDEKQSIESACSAAKHLQGPAAYNRCLTKQLRDLLTTK